MLIFEISQELTLVSSSSFAPFRLSFAAASSLVLSEEEEGGGKRENIETKIILISSV